MDRKQKLLGEILLSRRLISEESLKNALAEQKRAKVFLGEILLKNGYVKETDLLEALSEQFGIPLFSLKDRYVDWMLVKEFNPSLILDHRCIPIKKDDFSVTMGINNPLDAWTLKMAEEQAMGLKLKLVLLTKEDIDEVVAKYKEYIRSDINNRFK